MSNIEAISFEGGKRCKLYRSRWLARLGCFLDVFRRVQRVARRVRMARKRRRGWA